MVDPTDCYVRTISSMDYTGDNRLLEIDSFCDGLLVWKNESSLSGYEISEYEYNEHSVLERVLFRHYVHRACLFSNTDNFSAYKSYHTEHYVVTRIDTVIFNQIRDFEDSIFPNQLKNAVFHFLTSGEMNEKTSYNCNFSGDSIHIGKVIYNGGKEDIEQFGGIKKKRNNSITCLYLDDYRLRSRLK